MCIRDSFGIYLVDLSVARCQQILVLKYALHFGYTSFGNIYHCGGRFLVLFLRSGYRELKLALGGIVPCHGGVISGFSLVAFLLGHNPLVVEVLQAVVGLASYCHC